MFADADSRTGHTARRYRHIDPQVVTFIGDPAMAVVLIDQATLADDQEAAEGIICPRLAKTDFDRLSLALLLDREFSRAGTVDIGYIRVFDPFLEGAVTEQEIHCLLL